MNRLLITGGAGFIGSNFARYWLEKYPKDLIVVFDSLTYAGNRNNLISCFDSPNFKFVKGSVCDQAIIDEVFTENNINRVVHFAAESHVDRSITEPDAFITTNIVGTHTLLKVAKNHWLGDKVPDHLFHHVSTDEVYGSLDYEEPAFTETSCYAPNSPYASSKAASDHLVRAYHHTYGLKVTTSNCSNNYGPHHFPEKLIPLCLLNILNGDPLPIYGDGKQIRDWLYVEDHCRGIDLIMNKGIRGETYNIGGNNEWSNIDVILMLCKIVNKKFKVTPDLVDRFPNSPCSKSIEAETLISFVPDRPGHDYRYAIDAKKIEQNLGYRPLLNFEAGLIKTVAWYLDNEDWWKSILDGSYQQD
ncbi:MAG: dTDP-glucose 4,6-dehydratase [Gammaproteobacteria bacterium]|nr:dTDP-glucose 4,6-dehydratase [Gammaproteobacteria bacterium]